MNYDARTNSSAEERTRFIQWLTAQTVDQLQAASGDESALRIAVQEYLKRSKDAHLPEEEIEELLGINDPCIMDLAKLSESDEEIVVDAFEQFANG